MKTTQEITRLVENAMVVEITEETYTKVIKVAKQWLDANSRNGMAQSIRDRVEWLEGKMLEAEML